jgi:hypothetical protein
MLITKLLTNPLARSRSTADTGDQSPASGPVHHTGRQSMAWKRSGVRVPKLHSSQTSGSVVEPAAGRASSSQPGGSVDQFGHHIVGQSACGLPGGGIGTTFVKGVDLRSPHCLAAARDRLGQLLDASLRPTREKTRAPRAANSLATALPTSPAASKVTKVLFSRRRALLASVTAGVVAPFLR